MSSNPDPNHIRRRHEDQLHTYTPLFSPPTPRASPGPDATTARSEGRVKASRRSGYRANEVGVVVPEMQDPLSLLVSGSAVQVQQVYQFVGDGDTVTMHGGGGGIQREDQNQALGVQGSLVSSSTSRSSSSTNVNSSETPRRRHITAEPPSTVVHSTQPVYSTQTQTQTQTTTTTTNSTLAFFDKFVSEAKAASAIKRRNVLDEILLHQEDPLYFLDQSDDRGGGGKDVGEGGGEDDTGDAIATESDGGGKNNPDAQHIHMHEHKDVDHPRADVAEDGDPIATEPEHDGDHHDDQDWEDTRGRLLDALTSDLGIVTSPVLAPRKAGREHEARTSARTPSPFGSPSSFQVRIRTTSGTGSTPNSPRRSPTLTLPTLAPPLESTDNVSISLPSSSTSPTRATSMPLPQTEPSRLLTSRSRHRPSSSSSLSSSYATLSGLPTRWMSSFLSSAPTSASASAAPSPTVPPSSHIATPANSSPVVQASSTTIPNTTNSTTTTTTSTSSPSLPPNLTRHARSSTISTITHSTPFATHTFVPISGAPGFVDERYDWDKGYSNELMRELEDVNGRGDVVVVVDPSGSASASGSREGTPSGKKTNVRDVRDIWDAKENVKEGDREVGGGGGGGGKDGRTRKERIKGKWDDRHIGTGRSRTMGNTNAHVSGNDKENLSEIAAGGTMKVGEFMEKRTGSVELKGRKELTTPVLDAVLADLLRPQLPPLDRLPKTWHLVYSLDQHGISLNTLYMRCEAHIQSQAQAARQAYSVAGTKTMGRGTLGGGGSVGRPGMMMVVKDSGDSVFGVWVGEGIRQSRGKGYYGSGECFMWRHAATAHQNGTGTEKEFHVYKWTGKNKYVALCEPDYISFGGGDGKYGLYLNETLFDGSSARCVTFDNDPICSPGANKAGAVEFECVGLEVWGVGP